MKNLNISNLLKTGGPQKSKGGPQKTGSTGSVKNGAAFASLIKTGKAGDGLPVKLKHDSKLVARFEINKKPSVSGGAKVKMPGEVPHTPAGQRSIKKNLSAKSGQKDSVDAVAMPASITLSPRNIPPNFKQFVKDMALKNGQSVTGTGEDDTGKQKSLFNMVKALEKKLHSVKGNKPPVNFKTSFQMENGAALQTVNIEKEGNVLRLSAPSSTRTLVNQMKPAFKEMLARYFKPVDTSEAADLKLKITFKAPAKVSAEKTVTDMKDASSSSQGKGKALAGKADVKHMSPDKSGLSHAGGVKTKSAPVAKNVSTAKSEPARKTSVAPKVTSKNASASLSGGTVSGKTTSAASAVSTVPERATPSAPAAKNISPAKSDPARETPVAPKVTSKNASASLSGRTVSGKTTSAASAVGSAAERATPSAPAAKNISPAKSDPARETTVAPKAASEKITSAKVSPAGQKADPPSAVRSVSVPAKDSSPVAKGADRLVTASSKGAEKNVTTSQRGNITSPQSFEMRKARPEETEGQTLKKMESPFENRASEQKKTVIADKEKGQATAADAGTGKRETAKSVVKPSLAARHDDVPKGASVKPVVPAEAGGKEIPASAPRADETAMAEPSDLKRHLSQKESGDVTASKGHASRSDESRAARQKSSAGTSFSADQEKGSNTSGERKTSAADKISRTAPADETGRADFTRQLFERGHEITDSHPVEKTKPAVKAQTLVDVIARHQSRISGNQRMKVDAGRLGELDVRIEEHTKGKTLHIYVENESARQEVQKMAPAILNGLQAREIPVANVLVDYERNRDGQKKPQHKNTEKNVTLNKKEEENDEHASHVKSPRKYGYNTVEFVA